MDVLVIKTKIQFFMASVSRYGRRILVFRGSSTRVERWVIGEDGISFEEI